MSLSLTQNLVMRKNLRTGGFSLFSLFLSASFAYSQDHFAYAITDVNQGTASWTVLRKLDFQTGTYGDVLLNGVNVKQVPYDATSKKQIDGKVASIAPQPFSTGVAAIAYDKKNGRIYYTPMFLDQLRYVDLKSM